MKGTSYLFFFPLAAAFGFPLLLPLATLDALAGVNGLAAGLAAFFSGAFGFGGNGAGAFASGLGWLGVTATRAAPEIVGFWWTRIRSKPSIAGRYVQISA